MHEVGIELLTLGGCGIGLGFAVNPTVKQN